MAGNSMKLTRAAVDRIAPEPSKQKLVWDTEIRGFGVRVSPGGAKSYIIQRRVNGKERRVTIGRAGDISAEAARRKALSLAAQFLDGKDPVVEKRRQAVRSVTLRQAFDDYIMAPKKKGGGRGSPKKARTIADIKSVMPYFDDWLDLPASEISGAMVKERHAKVVARSAAQGNLSMRYLRAVFNHLMADSDDEDDPVIKRNPVDRLNRLNQWAEVKRASGYVPDGQLADWIAASKRELSVMQNGDDLNDAIIFMLLTGARVGETLGDPAVGYPPLAWSEVDLEQRTVILRDTKNRTDHEIPLGKALLEMLRARHSRAKGYYVFADQRGKPATPPQVRRALKRIGKKTGVTVSPHDLRRTFATIASKIDISAYKLKRLTNHVSGGDVTAGYVQISTEDLRDAMQRIEDFILSPARISVGNVVQMEVAS